MNTLSGHNERLRADKYGSTQLTKKDKRILGKMRRRDSKRIIREQLRDA